MQRPPIPPRLHTLVALAAFLAIALPVLPAQGQTSATGTISIDSPTDGATIRNGATVLIGGWAVDTAGPGTGVDTVRIYLNGTMDGGGTLLGTATYGDPRPDVASALGNPALTSSGFNHSWTPAGLPGGTHTLYIYAQSLTSGWFSKTVTLHVPIQPTATPAPAGPGPQQGQGPQWGGYPGPGTGMSQGQAPSTGTYGPGGQTGRPYYPDLDNPDGPRFGYPGQQGYGAYPGPGYPGYPGQPGYGYPGYPGYQGYPGYPGYPGGRPCLTIYPPPPGCF